MYYYTSLVCQCIGQIENLVLTAESSELIDPNKHVMVDFVSSEGTVLQSIETERGQGRSSNIFAMIFTTPSQPFQIHVRGTNIYGEPFERTIAEMITPLPFRLELLFLHNAGTITPDGFSYIHLLLSNKGPGDTFKINIFEMGVFNYVLSSEEFYVPTNLEEFFFVNVTVKKNQSHSELTGHLYKVTFEAVSQNSNRSTILTVDLVMLSGTVRPNHSSCGEPKMLA